MISTMNCPLCAYKTLLPFLQDHLRDYLQCPRCRLVAVPESQRLSRTEEKARYDLHRNDPNDPGYRSFLSRISDRILERIPPPARGLDFGSGPGPTLEIMLIQAGYEMKIYDVFYADHPEVFALEYDFVTCSEVVEHLFAPGPVLARLLALLKPGGLLAVMTKLVLDRERFKTWHYIRDPTHVCFFSRETFSWLAEAHGLGLEFAGPDVVLLHKPDKVPGSRFTTKQSKDPDF